MIYPIPVHGRRLKLSFQQAPQPIIIHEKPTQLPYIVNSRKRNFLQNNVIITRNVVLNTLPKLSQSSNASWSRPAPPRSDQIFYQTIPTTQAQDGVVLHNSQPHIAMHRPLNNAAMQRPIYAFNQFDNNIAIRLPMVPPKRFQPKFYNFN